MSVLKLLIFPVLSLGLMLPQGLADVAAGQEPGPGKPKRIEYTQADITEAYNAFNRYLLHPERKLYMRDTEAETEVGAIWTQAIYWDMAMNAYRKTGSEAHRQLVDDIFKGNYEHYDRFNWDNGKVWFIYDDIMWWVISLARAHELTHEEQYLALAESGFERVWSGSSVVKDGGSYDPVDGGMYWQWNQKNPSAPKKGDGKMACINYPTVIAAMTLYNNTKKPEYLAKAKEIYNWASSNLFDKQTGAVADSKHGNGDPHWKMHVYNQGTCIGAAMLLYGEAKDERYLNDAVLAANYVKETMSDAEGILPFGKGEEQGIYTAIFAQYIVDLIQEGDKAEYLPWLRKNINRGWQNRDRARGLTGKDYNRKVTAAEAVSCYDASGIPALMLLCPPENQALPAAGQVNLETQIDQIAGQINGRIGVYAQLLETGEAVSYNGEEKYPMQSVYKFPIAMAVLDKVDKGELSLDQQVRVDTSEYIPENGHSPLRDKFPGGATLTVRELLNYNVAESDGTACDVLLRLLGGTNKAQKYVRRLGVKDIAIATTEQVQVANDLIQYRNWATPRAMTQLLRIFYTEKNLSEESKALLLKHMSHSGPWFDRRIKGMLPPGTPVVHKTGTAGTINGLTRATNDAGIITLPNGKHVAITVFVSDSHAVQKDREITIARISRAVFDYYANAE